ncbi:MAG: DUF438 domain-containing protein [Bacteroidales bacterium]|nr:DUF438 domain-containing protein [Bacteroidales bacterium]
MSDHSGNKPQKLADLINFSRRLIDGESGKLLISEYRSSIETVTAEETMEVLDFLLVKGYPLKKIKSHVGKILNVFYKSLNDFRWNKPEEPHFLYYLMLENREVEKIITGIRPAIKSILGKGQESSEIIEQLRDFIGRLKEYELHYIKKENILFPCLEKAYPQYRCLQLMWSFHDDFRRSLKSLNKILDEEIVDRNALNSELGKLFFVIFPIIFREEQIVFPVAMKSIPVNKWAEMLEESFETGWCYGINPLRIKKESASFRDDGKVDLGTGFLKPEQIMLLLDNLPVDITFVDRNDEVCYFSGAKHRIFPRSKAVIGRKVQNCHPPESIYIVDEILSAFRDGSRDHADFWIQTKGRFIHIRYFALRDAEGNYMGTIEVSQDVTGIRKLQGEQRLLDWNM